MYHDLTLLQSPAAKNDDDDDDDDDDDSGDYGDTNNDGGYVGGTYLLTPWSSVLLEKLTGFQLVNRFPAIYGNRKFITAFTSAPTCP
jgi:hypothetical protein